MQQDRNDSSSGDVQRLKEDLFTVLTEGTHPDPETDKLIKGKLKAAFREDPTLVVMVEEALAFEKQELKEKAWTETKRSYHEKDGGSPSR